MSHRGPQCREVGLERVAAVRIVPLRESRTRLHAPRDRSHAVRFGINKALTKY